MMTIIKINLKYTKNILKVFQIKKSILIYILLWMMYYKKQIKHKLCFFDVKNNVKHQLKLYRFIIIDNKQS